MIRAIRIDPYARTVTEVLISGNGDSFRHEIGCHCFTLASIFENEDSLFVDDEGLFKSPDAFFLIKEYPAPLAGIGLLVGSDSEGNSVSAKTPLSAIKPLWMNRAETKLYRHAEQTQVDRRRENPLPGISEVFTTMNEALGEDE